jgi:hypothetical protein
MNEIAKLDMTQPSNFPAARTSAGGLSSNFLKNYVTQLYYGTSAVEIQKSEHQLIDDDCKFYSR